MTEGSENHLFLSILESHARLLHKVCWTYTRTLEDRDDLFQEIAVRLMGAIRNYDPSRTASTWVYRIALNVAIDFHRRRVRQKRVEFGLEGDRLPASDLERIRNDQLQELREHLEKLTEVDRALLMLHLDGNSHREIGEILGITETNVGTRLSRLKKTLRESINPPSA